MWSIAVWVVKGCSFFPFDKESDLSSILCSKGEYGKREYTRKA